MDKAEITVGTILTYSIGCGHDSFYQVVSRTAKTVKVRKLSVSVINQNTDFQTCDYFPIKDEFSDNINDQKVITLKIAIDGHIGPIKRMMGWHVWDGKEKKQWSS